MRRRISEAQQDTEQVHDDIVGMALLYRRWSSLSETIIALHDLREVVPSEVYALALVVFSDLNPKVFEGADERDVVLIVREAKVSLVELDTLGSLPGVTEADRSDLRDNLVGSSANFARALLSARRPDEAEKLMRAVIEKVGQPTCELFGEELRDPTDEVKGFVTAVCSGCPALAQCSSSPL